MYLNGVSGIYAFPNNDGTFYIKVNMEYSDKEYPCKSGNCVFKIPRATMEIKEIRSEDTNELFQLSLLAD